MFNEYLRTSETSNPFSGPGGSEAALEPAPHPVRQQHREPLGRPALGLLHGLLHHRGAGLLLHRRPHGAHEREELPRHGRLRPEAGQHLRLTPGAEERILTGYGNARSSGEVSAAPLRRPPLR